MTDRDRLIELLYKVECKGEEGFLNCPERKNGGCRSVNKLEVCQVGAIADHLLANGVIVPPCKVGDKAYILEEKCKFSGQENKPWESCYQYWDNVFKNKMWGCAGKDENGNKIYCKQKEMVWYAKEVEYSLLLYSNPAIVLGENLFLTKEGAETKLKERDGNG